MSGFLNKVGRKAAEMASEYVRLNGTSIDKKSLELLLERAMVEGSKLFTDSLDKCQDIPHSPQHEVRPPIRYASDGHECREQD